MQKSPACQLARLDYLAAQVAHVAIFISFWRMANTGKLSRQNQFCCRLKDNDGPIEPLLYILYFLPTSINTAWLSVASGIGIAIVGNVEHTPFPKFGAILLAAAVTVLSKPRLQQKAI